MGCTKLACLDLDSAAIMYDQHTNPNQDKLQLEKAIWSCYNVNYKVKTASNRVDKNLPSYRMWRHPSKSWRSLFMTHHELSKSRRHTWSWSRRLLLSFMSLQFPTNCLWCIRYRSRDDCWFPFAEGSQDLEGHSNSQHLSDFSTLTSKPKTPSEVTYKDQNNTAHTSGANHKPPSKLLTKIRTTQCTHLVQTKNPLRSYLQRSGERSAHINISLVAAPTIEYYYYYSILEDASMHNVTMRIVANGFDDALHIAFGERLLAAHERWMGSSLTMSRVDECIMNRTVEGVLGWWSAPATWAACHMPVNEWMNEGSKEGRKEGRKDGRMDGQRIGNLWVEHGDSACAFAFSYACEERKDGHRRP